MSILAAYMRPNSKYEIVKVRLMPCDSLFYTISTCLYVLVPLEALSYKTRFAGQFASIW